MSVVEIDSSRLVHVWSIMLTLLEDTTVSHARHNCTPPTTAECVQGSGL